MIDVRPLQRDEHPTLLAFAKQLKSEGGKLYGHMWFTGEESYRKRNVIGAFRDEQLVGAALIGWGVRRKHTWVHYLDVLPDWQNAGIGTIIMHWLMKESPWGAIQLKCRKDNDGGQRFYERLGFKRVGEDDERYTYSYGP